MIPVSPEPELDLKKPLAPEARNDAGTMDLLMDMELPLVVRFGNTKMLLRDLLKLTAGSVIDFGRSRENAVEVLVNGRLVARGTAVVVHGNYGVRIAEIAGLRHRLECGTGFIAGTGVEGSRV